MCSSKEMFWSSSFTFSATLVDESYIVKVNKTKLGTLLIVAVIGLAAAGFYFTRDSAEVPDETELHRVLHVFDGDTILVSIGGTSERVRLLGIDTPEVEGPSTREECFGAEASDKANILLSLQEVRLIRDPQSDDRDKFNRLLRYVYLANGTFVNEDLVRTGFATVYRDTEFEYKASFLELESQARELKIGLWGSCFTR